MRLLVLCVLFSFRLSSQEIPDSAILAKLNVKKLVLLRCEEGQANDTEAVYDFSRSRYSKFDFSNPVFLCNDSLRVLLQDEKGRILFSGCKIITGYKPDLIIDTVGIAYDTAGRKAREKNRSSLYGIMFNTFYKYDAAGHLLLETSDAHPDRAFMRIEYVYDQEGRLVSKTEWWTMQPESGQRDSADYIHSKIEYAYNKKGLITEAKGYDPFHASYCPMDWSNPQDPRLTDDHVIFRYIYIY